jgi:hypothetical protein
MAEQVAMPLITEDGAARWPAFPRVHLGLTAHPIPADPATLPESAIRIGVGAWSWVPLARLWSRDLSRELYADVGRGIADPGQWEASIRVYGSRHRRTLWLARATGFADAEAAKAWVDQWHEQAAWGCPCP